MTDENDSGKTYLVWPNPSEKRAELCVKYSTNCVRDSEIFLCKWCLAEGIESFRFSDAKNKFMVWSDPRINGVLELLKNEGKISIPSDQRNRNITYFVCVPPDNIVDNIEATIDIVKETSKMKRTLGECSNTEENQRNKLISSVRSKNILKEKNCFPQLHSVPGKAKSSKPILNAAIEKIVQLFANENEAEKSKRRAEAGTTEKENSLNDESKKAALQLNTRVHEISRVCIEKNIFGSGEVKKSVAISVLRVETGYDTSSVEECLLELEKQNKIMIDGDEIYRV